MNKPIFDKFFTLMAHCRRELPKRCSHFRSTYFSVKIEVLSY